MRFLLPFLAAFTLVVGCSSLIKEDVYKYDISVYGADIYYVHFESGHLFTEGGSVDTFITDKIALRDYLDEISAADMRKMFHNEMKLRSANYLSVEQIGDSLNILIAPRNDWEEQVIIPLVNKDTLCTGHIFMYGDYTEEF